MDAVFKKGSLHDIQKIALNQLIEVLFELLLLPIVRPVPGLMTQQHIVQVFSRIQSNVQLCRQIFRQLGQSAVPIEQGHQKQAALMDRRPFSLLPLQAAEFLKQQVILQFLDGFPQGNQDVLFLLRFQDIPGMAVDFVYVVKVRIACQKDYLAVRPSLSDDFIELQPRHLRHIDVHDSNVDFALFHDGLCLHGAGRGGQIQLQVILHGKQFIDIVPNHLLVIHNQYAVHHNPPSPPKAAARLPAPPCLPHPRLSFLYVSSSVSS